MTLISSLIAEYSTDVKTDLLKWVWSDEVKSGQTEESLITDVMEDDFGRTSAILVKGVK